MSRLTGTDAKGLMEAYQQVYAPQEISEEQVWEQVEEWVNSLVEEGHDLSEYTWEEMYKAYVEEAVGLVGVPKRAWDPLNLRQKALDASRRSDYPAHYSKDDIPTTKSGKVIPRSMAGKPVTDAGQATKPQPRKDPKKMGGFVPGDDRMPGQKPRPTLVNHSDLYDLVKGYLLDEGYADTEEAAIAIMSNMSEEWRQSIVDESVMDAASKVGKVVSSVAKDVKDRVTGKKELVSGPRGYIRVGGPSKAGDVRVSGLGPVGTYGRPSADSGGSRGQTSTRTISITSNGKPPRFGK
jgi:hypothetical protein